MRLIKSSYKIETKINSTKILKDIEIAGRTSYKSEDRITEHSAFDFVKQRIKEKHFPVIEFGEDITVRFICDRGFTHELVRHRLVSYCQESTRFCNYSKGRFENQFTFIIPEWTSLKEDTNYIIQLPSTDPEMIWLRVMSRAEIDYNRLIAMGWSPQQARSVLPNSLKTEIVAKANLVEWHHILTLRTSKAAHPQMRELMVPLLKEFKEKIPIIFDDIKENK